MTPVIGYCLAVLGVVLLAVGYFRKNRNLMLFGTIALVVGLGFKDMVAGARAGWQAG